MEFKDYYKILGVDNTASADDIKKAYRKLARKYHPDISKETDAEKKMRDINEAREVLGDIEKRAAYDQLGKRYQSGQDFQPPPDWNKNWDAGFEYSGAGFGGAENPDFSDFFANLFGQRGGSQGFQQQGFQRQGFQRRGEDRHAKILIDLADAYNGAVQTINLQSPELDQQGRVVTKQHSLKVQIPKGVKEGQHIRLSGKGSPGSGGGPAGDLYLEIHFNSDARYRVEGRDVYQNLPVTPWEAALGANIEVATPSGPVKLTIPPETQNGRKLRLEGRGIPGAEVGDLYIVIELVLPPADNPKARKLYEQMARELNFNPRQKKGA